MFTTLLAWFDYFIISVAYLITFLYVYWQWRTLGWWKLALLASKRSPAKASTDLVNQLAVSVLVPVRNEAENIGLLLTDLLAQDALGPADEIIVINDHSTDSTTSIARSFAPKVRLLELSDYLANEQVIAHKKAALTYGVAAARHRWIITTDGDCRWPTTVLGEVKAAMANGHEFICGPVLIEPVNSFLTAFQALDLLAYMGLTAAYDFAQRPILANGAHLSFSKELFLSIDGYAGINHLPSGDDVLLLQKVQRSRPATKVKFLTNPAAVVTTKPMLTVANFWAQRIRWAGKTAAYTSTDLRWAQGISFATSLVIISLAFFGFWNFRFFDAVLICALLKMGVDYWVLRSSSVHFGTRHHLKYYPLAAIVHPFYLVAIGTMALLGKKASWKGRSS